MRDTIFTVGLILGVLTVWTDARQAHAGFSIGIENLDRVVASSMGKVPYREYDYLSEAGSSSILFWETGGDSPSPRTDSLRDFLSILLSASHNSPYTRGTAGSSVKRFDSPPDGLFYRPDVHLPPTVGLLFFVCILPPPTPFLSGHFRPPRVIR